MKIKVLSRQSLLDLGVQHAGGAEAAFDFALRNGFSIADDLEVGTLLDSAPTVNRNVRDYFANNRLEPATSLSAGEVEEGIEFWYVEYDFVAS